MIPTENLNMSDAQSSKVCFGMTLYNRAQYLPEALESLLNQSYSDFQLVAVDDASTDATEEIMNHYASKDKRVTYLRNSTWEGMIAAWRKVFWKTYELHKPEYFAWASDHDRWHPDWLTKHLAAIQLNPEVALVYPQGIAIDSSGEIIAADSPEPCDTADLGFAEHMYRTSMGHRGAGYAVYGLFRVHHLLQAGVFRRVALPDRLLLTEIAAYGKIKCLSERLWYRRFFSPSPALENTLTAQRSYLFGANPAPFHSYYPFLSHVLTLLTKVSLFPTSQNALPMFRSLALAGLTWERRQAIISEEINQLQSILNGKKSIQTAEASTAADHFSAKLNVPLLSLVHQMDQGTDHGVNVLTIATLLFLMNRDDDANELKVTKQTIERLQKKLVEKNATKKELKKKLIDLKETYHKTLEVEKTTAMQLRRELMTAKSAIEEFQENLVQKNELQAELSKTAETYRSALKVEEESASQLRQELASLKGNVEQLQEELKFLEDEKEKWKSEAQAGIFSRLLRKHIDGGLRK
jgi:glycosyltransferase involved in cell wall biosynthesis